MKVKFGGIEFDNVLYDERRMSSICTSARQRPQSIGMSRPKVTISASLQMARSWASRS